MKSVMSHPSVVTVLRVLAAFMLLSLLVLGLFALGGEGLISLWLAEDDRWWVLVISSLVYALLLAIPFVPGVELGWLIIGVFGKAGILASWLSTIAGLSLSFLLAGKLRHTTILQRLEQARDRLLATDAEALPWMRRALRYGVCFYVQHPYVFAFITLNLPGNWVIGGGGGISAMTGLVPGIRYWRFVLTIAVATGIVPLLLWFGVA